jgi:hypothetical protein
MGWEGWKKGFGEDCIQTKWPDVALDLNGATEQEGAHDAPGRQAREAKVQINLSRSLPLHLSRLLILCLRLYKSYLIPNKLPNLFPKQIFV